MKILRIIKKVMWPLITIGVGVLVWFVANRDGIKQYPVKQVNIENRVITRSISASGMVSSTNEANLSFNATGRILGIYVKEGDMTYKGQLLAQLNNTPDLKTIQAAKDNRDAAQRDIDLYVEQYEDRPDSSGGRDVYEVTLRKKEETLSSYQATYEASQASLQNTYIYAPFAGTVVNIDGEIGENKTFGDTFIKIADLNDLVFKMDVDQEDFSFLKEGMEVEIKLDSYENTPFKGYVSKLPYFVDEDTDTFEIEIAIKTNEENLVKLGMEGDADIILAKTEEVPSLLFDVIYEENDARLYVWTAPQGKLKKQYIEIGLEGDVYTQIKTEITDPVVIPLQTDTKLEEGHKAKIVINNVSNN